MTHRALEHESERVRYQRRNSQLGLLDFAVNDRTLGILYPGDEYRNSSVPSRCDRRISVGKIERSRFHTSQRSREISRRLRVKT